MIELGLILIITLIWWFSEGRSVVYLSNLFFLGGLAIMLIGVLIAVGTIGGTSNWNYQFADSVNPDPVHERTARDWRERIKTQGQMLRNIVFGLPLILLGIVVHLIWG
jgi:hypothetical protein